MNAAFPIQLKQVEIQKSKPVAVVLKTHEDMLVALNELRQAFLDDHSRMKSGLDFDVHFDFGKKYIKVISTSHGGQESVIGFVVNVHDHKTYPYGTLLKEACWSRPELNKSRGDIFKLNRKKIQWTGIR